MIRVVYEVSLARSIFGWSIFRRMEIKIMNLFIYLFIYLNIFMQGVYIISNYAIFKICALAYIQ